MRSCCYIGHCWLKEVNTAVFTHSVVQDLFVDYYTQIYVLIFLQNL